MQELLETKEIGTLKRYKTPGKAISEAMKPQSKKPNLKRDVQRLINWMDGNVLPLIALVLLSGLATRGLQTFIPEMNETTRLVASILAVAVLVVKLKSSKV